MREDMLSVRKANYGPNTSLSYDHPLHIVRGQGTYLYDDEGNQYLDCINNVAHVGHANPKVVGAVTAQLNQLNTNSRYLHNGLTTYTSLLLSTMDKPLEVVYMVNSGSEANDLALRIARANRPGACHVAVMGGAYHGHTHALIPLSPYKFWGPGGEGKEAHVHVLPCPDPYRGENMDGRRAARAVIAAVCQAGGQLCAFFCESVLSCGGQVVLPPGYLEAVYEEMRAVGAIVIADEVQCGFGRVGSHFWGYQTQGVVPDIATVGKCVGNGYPVAALVTSRQLAEGFCTGMEYFNTYGGSTAAAAAALAVLRCILDDGLQQHAHTVGEYLKQQLKLLQSDFPFIGDVRGCGLMVGMELVLDPSCHHSHAPQLVLDPKGRHSHAPQLARWVKERMKVRRVLLSTDGTFDNVIKLKPPMVFGKEEADIVVRELRETLSTELKPHVWSEILQKELTYLESVSRPRMQRYRSNEASLYMLLSPLGHTGEGSSAAAATDTTVLQAMVMSKL